MAAHRWNRTTDTGNARTRELGDELGGTDAHATARAPAWETVH